MKVAEGPRPWTIHLVAGLILAQGLWYLISGLTEVYAWLSLMEQVTPDVREKADWTIIEHSARFTIICIPVIAIWLFASSIARWLVIGTGAYLAVTQLYLVLDIGLLIGFDAYFQNNSAGLITPVAMGIAASLLLAPSAARWFAKGDEPDVTAAFE